MFRRDTEDMHYVYDWRLQQENSLRSKRGSGMKDSAVVDFVNGCKYPVASQWLVIDSRRLPLL